MEPTKCLHGLDVGEREVKNNPEVLSLIKHMHRDDIDCVGKDLMRRSPRGGYMQELRV